MALNKVQLTINSRMYTVVSDESTEYMEMLGEHINEKVEAVMSEGRNIMGERPVVLAALNICDEYYKLAAEKSSIEADKISAMRAENDELKRINSQLRDKNKGLMDEISELESGQVTMAETEAIAVSVQTQKELDEAKMQIKFLEGQLKAAEEKNARMKSDYERREQEIFDMFDHPQKSQENLNTGNNSGAAKNRKNKGRR